MRKFTKFLQLLVILLVSSTMLLAQSQSTTKRATAKDELKKSEINELSPGYVNEGIVEKGELTAAEKEASAAVFSSFNDPSVYFSASPEKSGNDAKSVVGTIGTGTLITSGSTSDVTPYKTYWHDGQDQYLFTKAELNGAGLGGGNITALAFNVGGTPNTATLNSFTISIQHTTLPNLTGFTTTGWTTCFTGNVVAVAGWNTYTFTTPFNWDDVQNIMVKVCFDNTGYTSNSHVYYSASGFQSHAYYYTDGAAGCDVTTSSAVIANRPNVQLTGEPVSTPLLTVNPASLAFGYVASGGSAELPYVLAGTNLTAGPIVVTAPANFQVSLSSGSGFANSINVPYTPPTLANTTIYVKFSPTASGTYYTGDVTNVGGGSSANVAVSGHSDFYALYCTSMASNSADEEIYSVTVNGATNAYDCFTVAPGPGSILNRYSNFRTLGSLTNLQAGLTYNFSILEDECDGATYYNNGCAIWIDFNKDGDFLDADEQVYTEAATTISPRTINGSIIIPASAVLGETAMRITVAESYYGATLTPCLAYGYGETEDYLVTIAAPTSPYLSAVPISLNFGSVVSGGSAELPYVLSGDNLGAGPIVVTAPANYQVSLTSGSGFANSINVTYTPPTLANTTIYVKFSPTAPSTIYSGNVTNVGGGASTSVAVTGSSPCEPFVAPYLESFTTWPPSCWDMTGGTYSWIQYTTGVSCARANFWSQSSGNTDIMTSGAIDVSGLANPSLKFDWSHLYSATYPLDALEVLVSDDGTTWTQVWYQAGAAFNSGDGAGNTAPGTFVSSGNIDLTSFGNLLYIKFYGYSGYGPDVFVDNVEVYQPLAHDATTVSIDMPILIGVGSVNPLATVKNTGLNAETFNVQMTIGAYTSTKSVTLNSGSSTQITFDPWNAVVGTYTIQVCTQLGGDLYSANDCLSKPIEVQVLRKVYGYNAFDPSSVLPEGPVWYYIQTPGTITSLAATTSDQFISAGTWANDIWYASEYYDADLLSGGGWWTIDPLTGAMTKVGDFDIGFAGIAYDKNSGIMYGTNYDGASDDLYTIDPLTGTPTLIADNYSTQLSINLTAAADGNLYAVGLLDDQLYRITPSVPPVIVAVGPTGQAFNYAQDMEYDWDNDIMYAAGYTTTGTLYTVDYLGTGACTAIGNFQGAAEICGFAIPYTMGHRVYGNVYYGDLNNLKPQATLTTVTLTPGSTVSTGAGGAYEITAIADGTYQLAGATTKAWGGLNAPDPSFTQQYILGTRVLSNLQKRAADINFSGTIQSLDVTMMKRRILGQTYTSWVRPTEMIWDGPFLPGWHGTSPLWTPVIGLPVSVAGSDVNQNVRCLFTGDVNESFTPSPNP